MCSGRGAILYLKRDTMNQLNSIILEGNISRKAELTQPFEGFKVCKFPIAVNRKSKTPSGEIHEEVSFFDVEAYGKMAETAVKWCDKGKGVRVVGRLKQNRWEENNVKKSKVYIVAEHIEYKFTKSDLTNDENSEASDKNNESKAPEDTEEKAENTQASTQTASANSEEVTF